MKTILALVAALTLATPALALPIEVTDRDGNYLYGNTDDDYSASGTAEVFDDDGKTYTGVFHGDDVVIFKGPHGEVMHGTVMETEGDE